MKWQGSVFAFPFSSLTTTNRKNKSRLEKVSFFALIHLTKRALKPEDFDLDVLAEKAEQFSGAEIEGAVKDAVLEAFIDGDRAAKTKDIIAAIGSITPTAEMMKTKIDEIRDWAKNNIKGSRAAPVQQTTNNAGGRVLEI